MTKKTTTKPKANTAVATPEAPKASAPEKKVIFKPTVSTAPKATEYELLQPGGIMYLLRTGPVGVYDASSDSIRSMRYIPRENSVWTDEQSAKPTKEPIIFESGRLFVRREQPNLVKFMDLHPGNQANGGNVFKKVDLGNEAKKDLQSEYDVLDAISLIRTKPLSEILAVATALALKTDREVDEIKHDLMVKAKADPQGFIEAFDNPAVETKAMIRKAMSMSVIKEDRGHVKWTDTNKHIVAVPVGQDAVEVMTRFCMTENGSLVLDEIVRQL